MLFSRLKRICMFVAMAILVVAMATFVPKAHGEIVLDVYGDGYEAKNPVASNITRVKVNKLDKSDHEHVAGALLCIINDETGDVVDTWESNGTTHEIARNVEGVGVGGALDIDTWYVLKELAVPEGYSSNFKDLQDDPDSPHLVRFMIHSDDFNTTGEMEIDDEIAEFVESREIHGSGTEQAFVINLYNESVKYVEKVVERIRKSDKDDKEEEDAKEDGDEGGSQSQKEDEKEPEKDKDKDRDAAKSTSTSTSSSTSSSTGGKTTDKSTSEEGTATKRDTSRSATTTTGTQTQSHTTTRTHSTAART
ncbi:MAG: hypothetical protein U0J70_05100, partial [Atopobiaceae bacterium]|nr:hypothetical protein [Atopobiaceae bacterium]